MFAIITPMISYLRGEVLYIDEKFIILDTHGVGYKIHLTPESLSGVNEKKEASFYTYLAVRETALDLYGFTSMNELSFFEMLLNVSGIGPKSALGILSIANVDTLKRAIATSDTSYLNKVSGIGRKTADKIVIELRDKLQSSKGGPESPHTLRGESDAIEALKALGYSPSEAREALRQIPEETEGINARIKEALKILSRS